MKQIWPIAIDCPNCAAKLEAELEKVADVTHVRVNYLQKTLTLEADDDVFSSVAIAVKQRAAEVEPDAVIGQTSLDVPSGAMDQHSCARHHGGAHDCACHGDHTRVRSRRQLRLSRAVLAAVLLAAGLLVKGEPGTIVLILAWLLAGYDVLLKALRNILRGQLFDENFLMAVASLGAVMLGEHAEAVAVMVLYQMGEYFQDSAVEKSRASITELMDVRPDVACLLKNGQPVRVHPETVAVDDLILVRPGEKIPLDGVIIEGASSLNTAALTGESLPRDVAPGDSVLSGCVNETGVLTIRVTAVYGESTVSKILRLVEESGATKARTERFITRFARIYTPLVCLAALLLAVMPSLLDGQWSVWIHRGLTFLMVSCPCALVISVPLTFFSGIGGASRQGILMKGANHLETLARTKRIAFDKTGTLTQGVFRVQSVHPADESVANENVLLELAALAEAHSSHPVSQSLRAAWGKPVDLTRMTHTEEWAGHGVKAKIDGHRVYVGNERLMTAIGLQTTASEAVGTLVHVAQENRYLGWILIADEVKPTAKEAIDSLKQAGITDLTLLTGDRRCVAEAVAVDLGLSDVHAQLLPADKVRAVEAMLSSDQPLAFVGDGINDAPVLRRADVGVAMGVMGSDAAMEAADVILMDDDPRKITQAIRMARRTVMIARQNIAFALGVKLLVMILSTLGMASMWLAVFVDVGVAMLCILNAMRAMRHQASS